MALLELAPTTAASLVLRHKLCMDSTTLAQSIAEFAFPQLTWIAAVKSHQTDASALRCVKLLHAHHIPQPLIPQGIGYRFMAVMWEAIKRGFNSVAKFLHETNCSGYCTRDAIDAVAEYGSLELIQFFHEHHPRATFADQAIKRVARRGDLEIVKYLVEVAGADVDKDAWENAALGGHLDLVQYFHARYNSLPELERTGRREWTTCVMDEAAESGHLEVVQYLHAHTTVGCTTQAMDRAARGDLETVRWLHENRTEGCTTQAMDNAAGRDQLDIVRFLHENRTEGCTSYAMCQAMYCASLSMVEYLYENRVESCVVEALDHLGLDEMFYWEQDYWEQEDFLRSKPCRCAECNEEQEQQEDQS